MLDESAIKGSGGVTIHEHLISDPNARKALLKQGAQVVVLGVVAI